VPLPRGSFVIIVRQKAEVDRVAVKLFRVLSQARTMSYKCKSQR